MLTDRHRVVLLQHGGLDDLRGKTGLALLRYRRGPVVAVIDPVHAGQSLRQVCGIDREVPVVATMGEALEHRPEVAVVGLAPSGGRLPPEMRADITSGLRAGLSLASGLHSRLGEDEELAGLRGPQAWIWDLRREPDDPVVGSARAAALPCHRVLAVGTDMSVGKMSACLELRAAALEQGLDARFVGTGQAGILIDGRGVALDAVRIDYASGAVEQAVLAAATGAGPGALLLVEGQGSLAHPGSSATLPLIRGSQPTALLMVHRAGQRTIRTLEGVALPPLPELIACVESIAALGRPPAAGPAPRVAAVALNTAHLDEAEALEAMEATAALTGLPCADVVRHGGKRLLESLLAGGKRRASEGTRTPE